MNFKEDHDDSDVWGRSTGWYRLPSVNLSCSVGHNDNEHWPQPKKFTLPHKQNFFRTLSKRNFWYSMVNGNAWFIDHIWAAWQILPDPRIDELASMFFELTVCGWRMCFTWSFRNSLSKMHVGHIRCGHPPRIPEYTLNFPSRPKIVSSYINRCALEILGRCVFG